MPGPLTHNARSGPRPAARKPNDNDNDSDNDSEIETGPGMSDDNTFDYIIVGAGTAGALMANRLSADRNRRVLLIEAGRKDDYHWIHIPVGYLYCIGNPRTDWLYTTE